MDSSVPLATTPPTNSNSNKSPPGTDTVLSISQKTNIMSQELVEDTLKERQSPNGSGREGGAGWEDIRELDNEENWTERTRVITKPEHQFYSDCAKEFVTNIVDNLPVDDPSDEYDYGITGGNNDVITNAEAPPTSSAGTTDYSYMNEFSDQDFKISASQFDVDFLERVSTQCNPLPSTLARESLYVKFDPLVGPPHSHPPSLPPSFYHPPPTMSGDSLLLLNTPPSSTPRAPTSITSKETAPTATPSYNLLQFNHSPKDVHNTAPTHNTRTLLDASPSSDFMNSTTGRVSSPYNSGGPSLPPIPRSSLDNTELVKVLKYSEVDLQQILVQIRQECQTEVERHVQLVKEEYAMEMLKTQKKMERLVKELQNLRSNNALQTTGNAKIEEELVKLKSLCDEHKDTNTKLIDMYEKLKEESQQIEQQRDQALSDFNSIEKSFAEFHQRHIKARETLAVLQKSETSLQKHISELEEKVNSLEQVNTQLQNDTVIKIQEANKIYDKLQTEHASDIAVTKANVKKMTMQISSLEGQLNQKEQEKLELTQICEDLMKELGSK